MVHDLPDTFVMLMAISGKGEGKSNGAARKRSTRHRNA
jgi:hypothetical protein